MSALISRSGRGAFGVPNLFRVLQLPRTGLWKIASVANSSSELPEPKRGHQKRSLSLQWAARLWLPVF